MKLSYLLALLLVVAPLCAQEAPKEPVKEPAKEAPKEEKKEEKKDKPKNIDETIKDWEKLPGVFTLYRKLDGNKQKLMLELSEAQLDKLYMLQMTASSSGAGRINAGSPLTDVVLKWQKTPDDRLLLV